MTTLTIDCRMAWQSGIGRYIRDVVPALLEAGDFSVSCIGAEDTLKKLPWYDKVSPIIVQSIPFRPWEHIEIPLAMPATDLYWAPQFCIPWAARLKARKLIVTVHDVFHVSEASSVHALQRLYMKALLNFAGRAADQVIAVSDFTRSEILRYTTIPDRKIRVILNGIDPDFASGSEYLSEKDRYILCVGNIKPHKNIRNSIAAFRTLISRFPDIHLHIVGMKSGFFTGCEDIEGWAEGLEDKVHFLGHLSDRDLKNQ